MKIKEILRDIEYETDTSVGELEFSSISFREKEIGENTLYIKIKSTDKSRADINTVNPNITPIAVVSEERPENLNPDIPFIKVENARRALSFAFFRFFKIDLTKIKLIGVTGTNGKTTTATMIEKIISDNGKRVGFIGTGRISSNGFPLTDEYYSMTTPDPDRLYSVLSRMINDGCEYAVMEISSHSLALEKIAPLRFEVCVFTNVSHEHLDFHESIEDYFRTKMKLFDQSAYSIFNIDDPLVRNGYSELCNEKESVGILFDADTLAKEPRSLGFGGSVYLHRSKKFIFRMNLPLVGAYNIYNALLAVSAAVRLGFTPKSAKIALESMSSPRGRFEIIEDKITVIIDYAHTPKAMENAIKTVNSCKNSGQKLIVVFGCGGNRDKSKRPVMGRIAELYADISVITNDNPRDENENVIIDDILSGFEDKSRAAVIYSRRDAIESAIAEADDKDIILILGKGAEKYNIDKNGITPFDETEIVKAALKKRHGGEQK